LNGKELDIYVPGKKLAIELDGLYWHSEINGKKPINYHLAKTEECENIGIQLVHIFDDEWINKQTIIKDKLKKLANVSASSIYARKCQIREITHRECHDFLERYHLQGSDRSKIKLGAFHNNEMVSVMTFGPHRIALGNTKKSREYEMYRFCVNKKVIGIAGKLLAYFVAHYSPKKIVTYADRRYSSIHTSFYPKVGFKLIAKTKPNYWYTKNYSDREYRFKYRKSELPKLLELFDPGLTEWENMQKNGYDRIWDCGHLKYEMVIT
jgi:hypothetical protein